MSNNKLQLIFTNNIYQLSNLKIPNSLEGWGMDAL